MSLAKGGEMMANFKKRQRVIVTNPLGQEFKGILVSASDYREPSMKYAVDIGGSDVVFVGDKDIKPDNSKEESK